MFKQMMRASVIMLVTVGTPLFAQQDKLKHAVAGIAVSNIAGGVAERRGGDKFKFGCASAVVVGAAKELYDASGRGTPDLKDFLATALAGCLTIKVIF